MILAIVLTWVVDRYTKLEALKYSSIHYYGPFVFSLQYNSGAMLGMFKQLPDVLRIVTLSTAGAFLFFSFFVIQYLLPTRAIILRIGLALLIGGIIGNVADRITWGAVIDFVSIKYYKDKVTPVFNIADLMQWIGHLMILVSLFKYADVFWPDANVRKTRWINLKFQLKYCFILTISSLSMALIVSILAYTYLRVTLSTLTNGDTEMLHGYLYPFVLSLCAVTAIFIGALFIFGKSISHRVAGPVYALERYIDDLIGGNYRPFKVRKNDDFQQFTAVGLRLKEHIMSLSAAAHEKSVVAPAPTTASAPSITEAEKPQEPDEPFEPKTTLLRAPTIETPVPVPPQPPQALTEVKPPDENNIHDYSHSLPQISASAGAVALQLNEPPLAEPMPARVEELQLPPPLLSLLPPLKERKETVFDALKIRRKMGDQQTQIGASISGVVDAENTSTSSMDLTFNTGSTSEREPQNERPAERLRITSQGNVGIGTPNPENTLHVVGSAGLSSGSSWRIASDERLQEIGGEFRYGLEDILKIQPIHYRYKNENSLGLPHEVELSGFNAQEIQKVIPEAVQLNPRGYLELNVDPIHWAAINAIKELHNVHIKKAQELAQEQHIELELIRQKLEALEAENHSLRELKQSSNLPE
jgi:signal peptidase II